MIVVLTAAGLRFIIISDLEKLDDFLQFFSKVAINSSK